MKEEIDSNKYEIKIVDTYIDKKTGELAKDFGKIYKVPTEISDEKAKMLIKHKIARKVENKDGEIQTKGDKKSKNKV